MVYSEAENLTVIYTCGRVTSLLFSVASAGLVFLAGYKLKGLKAGIISGLLFVSVPIFAMHSKFIAVDTTCGFFVALSLYISAFIEFPKKETDIFLI